MGPQPDDIEVGAGATVAKLTAAGKRVTFLVLTDGNVRLVNVSDSPDNTDKIFTKIPEILDQVSGIISKKKEPEEE